MDREPVETVLCLASYEKGDEFLREMRRLGRRVIFLTVSELKASPFWPRDSIDEFYDMPDTTKLDDVINAVCYLARSRRIDRVVAVDEYDVPIAAALREYLQLPGMGQTVARRFRDKLAMRVAARRAGILVPDFTGVFNDEAIARFTQTVPGPWLLKPRSEATAIGIAKVERPEDIWPRLESLGDRRSAYLLERFVPGEIFHVDSVICRGEPVLAEAHKYGRPPMDVFHGGGIAMSRAIPRESEDAQLLQEMNRHVLSALGMEYGVTHMEFIKAAADGRFYFLEVGPRPGGAHTVEMVEAETGINLYDEWARLEVFGDRYRLPERAYRYAGVILSLARQEHPDTSAYTDPEIVYRVDRRHHVGFVLSSDDPERIRLLEEEYSRRMADDFGAAMPAWEERPHGT